MDIHHKDKEAFDSLESVTYEMTLIDYDTMTQQVKNLKCGVSGLFPT